MDRPLSKSIDYAIILVSLGFWFLRLIMGLETSHPVMVLLCIAVLVLAVIQVARLIQISEAY